MLRAALALCLALTGAAAMGAPCDSAAHRAFDFWLDEREVRTPDGKLAGSESSLKLRSDLELEHSPKCGGELKVIAAILAPPVIEKSLTRLGLQARAPPRDGHDAR